MVDVDALGLLAFEPPLGDPVRAILGFRMLDEIAQDRSGGLPVLDCIRRFGHCASRLPYPRAKLRAITRRNSDAIEVDE